MNGEKKSKIIDLEDALKILDRSTRCKHIGVLNAGEDLQPYLVMYKTPNSKKPIASVQLIYVIELIESYMEALSDFEKQ